ncbi:hypothetical protein ACB098_08G033400 [Castanea mollissima]
MVKPRRFNIGDLVLKRVSLATKNPVHGKLGLNWEGPYRVINCKRQGSYYLERGASTEVLSMKDELGRGLPWMRVMDEVHGNPLGRLGRGRSVGFGWSNINFRVNGYSDIEREKSNLINSTYQTLEQFKIYKNETIRFEQQRASNQVRQRVFQQALKGALRTLTSSLNNELHLCTINANISMFGTLTEIID